MQLSLPLSGTEASAGDPAACVFVRHRRARRYILRVLSDGTVRVTLPRWGARNEARAFVTANRAWIEEQRRRALLRCVEGHRLGPAESAELERRARRELPIQLLDLAARHHVTVPRISIRNQKTRWGACSPSGTITLNWRLIRVPDFVREYVLVHELMHRRELNHSRRFWRLVAAACPRMAEARAWLRQEGKTLWSDAD